MTNDQNFMGMNNFVWWFGVVENRLDPLELGRCQVRCFGWHTEDTTQIPIADLPWAHPVLPFGTPLIKPPAEGTMVFGFFADGTDGRFPILLGTVPGIPEEMREPQTGFTDPYTDAQKASHPFFPKRLKDSLVNVNGGGPTLKSDVPKRNPVDLNIPSISKLARPDRIEGDDGSSLGVRSESIANTTIDFQRRNRVVGIKSAGGYSWREPFPSFNANYPFNNVTETESGHAIEMDDTRNFERVQLSHRTGSTLEFLPSASVKLKSFNHRYDVTMGNHKEYVNGTKDTTVQSDMFLRINGKLVIQCDGVELISSGDIDLKGKNVNITAGAALNLYAGSSAKITGAGNIDLTTRGLLNGYGGAGVSLDSGGITVLSGTPDPLAFPVTNPLMTGVKIVGPNFWVSTLITEMNSVLTSILPQVPLDPSLSGRETATLAKRVKTSPPTLSKTTPSNAKEKTDSMAFLEKQEANVATKLA
jgi:hypothetical protein